VSADDAPEVSAVPEGPWPVRWPGYPGTPLTHAPWGPWAAIGFAAAAIILNVAMKRFLAADAVTAAFRAAILVVAANTGVDRVTLAALFSTALMVALYAVLLLPVLVVARRRGVPFFEAVGLRPVRKLPAAGFVAGVVILSLWFGVQYSALMSTLGWKLNGTSVDIMRGFGRTPTGIVLIFLVGGVLAPFVEEIVFRGVVFSSLRDHWGEGRALLVSSALFGIIHLAPLSMVPTGFIGLLLARAFSSTRSLWPAVIAHSVYNSTALALGLLATGLMR
jgi:membrane protease YdiL (CAAX protease family)